MFSLCPVVCPVVQCQHGLVHYTHATGEASYDRARSVAIKFIPNALSISIQLFRQ